MDKEKHQAFFTKAGHISLWEAGIRWAGFTIKEIEQDNIPSAVLDAFRSLIEGQLCGAIDLINPKGEIANPKDEEEELFYTHHSYFGTLPDGSDLFSYFYETYLAHDRVITEGHFDRSHLENSYLIPKQIGKWSVQQELPFPDFCFSAEQRKKLESEYLKEKLQPEEAINDKSNRINKDLIDTFWGRLRNEQKFRLMAREVAKRLWEKDPSLTVAKICKDEFILKYCSGANYTDDETIRNWIKDLNPKPIDERGGRPKNK